MVYTERFVRGTEPGSYCELHGRYETDGWRIASAGRNTEPRAASSGGTSEPRPAGDSGVAAAVVPPVATSGALPSSARGAEQPPTATPGQRRGFWSRIFRGQDQVAPQAPAGETTR
jgi:hypothetical protein